VDEVKFALSDLGSPTSEIGSEIALELPPALAPGLDRSLYDLLRLDGRTAVVTGGARGIGGAIADRLAEAGAAVVVGDLDISELSETSNATLMEVDLLAPDGPDRLVQRTLEIHGRLDVWVNNAGIYPTSHVLDITDQEWNRVIELNLTAAFRGARAAARAMTRHGSGVIVNVASNAGMASGPATAHYVASKHGIVGLTKSLAIDLAPHGIRAVGIAPGVTMTEGLSAAMAHLADHGWGDMEAYAARTVPLGRMAHPDEIARVVVFVCSDLAQYITGTTILVDGGQVVSFT
jgi:NAD(P)-dependent dehydrogenase (short-subunit alcohol dehydrogenase family)